MARVLVIDDDPEFRSILRVALERAGHEVLVADEGGLGIRTHRRQPADLILCDIFMSGKEGLETIMDLRHHFANVRIVAMSGGAYASRMDCLPVAKKLGAAAILKKPFDMQTLSEVIEEVLRGSGGAADDRQDSLCG